MSASDAAGLPAEIAAGEDPDRPVRRFLRRVRSWVGRHPRFELGYRIAVGALGGLIAIVGLILVPLPGPGWLIVFLGLGVLGTEFGWARRLAGALKRLLARFWAWWKARKERKERRTATTKPR